MQTDLPLSDTNPSNHPTSQLPQAAAQGHTVEFADAGIMAVPDTVDFTTSTEDIPADDPPADDKPTDDAPTPPTPGVGVDGGGGVE